MLPISEEDRARYKAAYDALTLEEKIELNRDIENLLRSEINKEIVKQVKTEDQKK